MKNIFKMTRIKSGFLIISYFFSPHGLSEVTLDGSMGTAGALNGPDYQIKEELGRRTGNNLFHSFDQLNLNNTESATFSGSAGIRNVINRVTGGQSDINGTIRVTIPDANLYLLNPEGIIFGKDAKLDVPGAFHASTADVLKFQDGVQLNSQETTANPVLTTAAPEAFGFLDETPANISLIGGNNTVLEVTEGKTLSLVGGDITIKDAALYAPGGQVNLASVGSVGDVAITESGLDTASFEKMGAINISQNPLVQEITGGQGVKVANIDVTANTAGKVFIRGGQMVMENTSINSLTIDGEGGGIDIGLKNGLNAESLTEKPSLELTSQSSINSASFGKGKASNIVLDTDGIVKLTDGGKINSFSGASGDGGDLTFNANTILLEGDESESPSRIATRASETGGAGNIFIETGSLRVYDKGAIFILAGKKSERTNGNIDIYADDTVSLIGKYTRISNDAVGNGDSGNISIESEKLDVRNGAYVRAATFNSGSSGDLLIDSDNIVLTNDNTRWMSKLEEGNLTGIRTTRFKKENADTGSSGNLTVKSNKLTVSNGAQVKAENYGQGKSGNLSVESDEIDLTTDIDVGIFTSAISTDSNSSGNSGNLLVKSSNYLMINNGASINVGNQGTGNSGNIDLESRNIFISRNGAVQKTGILNNVYPGAQGKASHLAVISDSLTIVNGGQISGSTFGEKDAGRVSVTSKDIKIAGTGVNSEVFTGITTQTQSSGNAGNLTVIAGNIKMDNGAQISSNTSNTGNAGDIQIKTNRMLLSGDNTVISSQSGFIKGGLDGLGNLGNAGDVSIEGSYDKSEAELITMHNGASIITTTEYNGEGGNLTIQTDQIDINNSALYASTLGDGDSGKILILANGMSMSNNATIGAFTSGSGSGGNVDIRIVEMLEIRDNSSILVSAIGEGKGGDLDIETADFILNNSKLNAGSVIDGLDNPPLDQVKSGNIFITATGKINFENNSEATTFTTIENAGKIELNGGGIFQLSGGSKIFTAVFGGEGKGGDISINAPISVLDNSLISSQAAGGVGGDITISDLLFKSPASRVTAFSKLSMDGEIKIKPVTNISGSIAVLPNTIMEIPTLLSNHCSIGSDVNKSSFVIKSGDVELLEPGNLAPSNFIDYTATDSHSSQKMDGSEKPFLRIENNNQSPIMAEGCIE